MTKTNNIRFVVRKYFLIFKYKKQMKKEIQKVNQESEALLQRIQNFQSKIKSFINKYSKIDKNKKVK